MPTQALSVTLRVRNTGDGPIYNLVGQLIAKGADVPSVPIYIGNLDPDESLEVTAELPVTLDMVDADVSLTIAFRDAHDFAPQPVGWSGVLPVEELDLSSTIEWIDDDGEAAPGEQGEVAITLHNPSSVPAAVAITPPSSARFLSVDAIEGASSLRLDPGARTTIRYRIGLRPQYNAGDLTFEVHAEAAEDNYDGWNLMEARTLTVPVAD